MKYLYAPWRELFVKKAKPKAHDTVVAKDCVFCQQLQALNDKKYFIIKRFRHGAIMMNLYPYNAGHLMVLPHTHHADVLDLSPECRSQLFQIATLCTAILKKELNADGFNLGLNMGAGSGGGIPHHLHLHVLPRWIGDTNFLETLGGVKVISSDMPALYQQLKEACDAAAWPDCDL